MNKMRNRISAILLAAVFGSMACTCYAAESKDTYTFSFNGVEYSLGMEANAAKATLGEAKASRDVNNCANGYVNKAYIYGETQDFEVLIEQDEHGREVVSNITLLTDKVTTEEGLKVGDPESRIRQIYPNARKGFGTYTVLLGDSSLYIRTANGKISFISYI